jgi:hypothetical protein
MELAMKYRLLVVIENYELNAMTSHILEFDSLTERIAVTKNLEAIDHDQNKLAVQVFHI